MKKLLVSSAVALALHGPSTFAQSWVNAGESDWTVGANWSGGTAPDGSAAVTIDNGGTAVLDNAAGQALSFVIGDTADGNLALRNAGVLSVSATSTIANAAASTGAVTLSGPGTSLAIVSDTFMDLIVGNAGAGSMSVSNGAQLNFERATLQSSLMTGELFLAELSGSSGSLSLDGSGTRFDAFGVNVIVGQRGTGALSITGGAVMELGNGNVTPFIFVGGVAGSNGTLTLDGTGSVLRSTGYIDFGPAGGDAEFSITGAAVLETIDGIMGFNGGVSTGVISGPGSIWRTSGVGIWMAETGQAELHLRDGGELELMGPGLLIMTFADPSGVATINLGDGGAPGILDAVEVRGGLGTPRINFNHNTADFHFSRDGTAIGDPVWITGPVLVNHSGSGTTTMGHANYTYTGATTVESGTLLVEGNMVSDVTVQAGGTLGGSGQVGALTLLAGGVLAPGTSPGVLNSGTLVLNGTSLLDFELGSPAGTPGVDSDLIEVTGDLTLDGVIDVTALAGFAAGTFRIINYSGTLTDNTLNVGTLPVGFAATVDTATAGQVNLVVTATVPPGTQISGPSPVGGGNITADLAGGGSCTFASGGFVATGSVATPPPSGLVLPYGLFEFDLTGCAVGATASITLTYPGVVPSGARYWKFGPTLADPVDHWYSLPATVAGNTLTFSVTDGGAGDSDLVADGNISDPGGAGLMASGAVPTLQTWALLLLGSLLAWTGFRRREGRGPLQA